MRSRKWKSLDEPTGPGKAAKCELQFRRLLEKLPAGAYTCDAQGLITYYNQHAVKLWGRMPMLNDARDRFCGSFKLFSADGQPIRHDECWMALALEKNEEFNGQEIIVERPDGSRLTVLAHANPIHDESGKLAGAVNVLVDISDRKRYVESLERADRAKNEFLATLGHELRNPLAPISNALNIMRLSDELDPAVERLRHIMEEQVRHLVRLVDDLLEIARITSGKTELRKQPVDVAAIIASAVETSRPLMDVAGHQLAMSLPPEPLMLDADSVRLTQVIANLLNNAAKYSKPGGQVWLSARREGDEAIISVRDNGLGIPPEMLSRVFDMFSQSDRTLTRSQGGLGIGLTLVRRFVEMHDGRVEAHSEGSGKGSEFVVRLPALAAIPRPPNAAPETKQNIRLPRRRVLVVDDTRASSFVLGKLLEKLGQDVHVAASAHDALEWVEGATPNLVISDISMPDMDGYELARRLRLKPELKETVLVALTGYGQACDKQRAQEAGFDHHLVKPISLDYLQSLLATLPRTVQHA